jgi:predicted secreted hydrolase
MEFMIDSCRLAVAVTLAVSGCSAQAAYRPDQSPTGRAVHLPADNAMHPSAHSEWWYVVGHLTDGHRNRYGFETTLFKFTHLQLPNSKLSLSVDKADVALTDVRGQRFMSSVSYIEPGIGPANLSTHAFSERLGPDKIWSPSKTIHLKAATGGILLRLSLRPVRPAILEGGTGIVPMGAHGFSYYYSYPDLAVRGRIFFKGRWRSVSGIAWLDHQWGNWRWSDILGWTWGAFHLSNGVDFSASSFRTRGKSLHGVTVSLPGGRHKTVADVQIKPTGHWRSTATGVTYGSGWIVTIPRLRARLVVRPLLKDQLVYDHTLPAASYWEGDCAVMGTFEGRQVRGQVYMELVGGSRRFRIA